MVARRASLTLFVLFVRFDVLKDHLCDWMVGELVSFACFNCLLHRVSKNVPAMLNAGMVLWQSFLFDFQ